MQGNPYPGPQAFDSAQAKFFYGRHRELRILGGLAEARRASLLFSPSGAGKSSLINAGLLPTLTETRATGRGSRLRAFQRMYLVGSASVGGEPRGVAADNTYVYLALQSLRPNRTPEELAHQQLADGLEPLLRQEHSTPGLLILDQFEELFTRNLDRWRERAGFFEQLRETFDRHPALHLLISMREEFIAELTPFAGLLPERLQSRYRLERLRREAALEAVTLPAAEAGCPFAGDEVAQELVDNLLGGKGAESGDEGAAALGEFVEPVHLQIVCRQLWQGLAEGSTSIRSEDLVAYADVDEALSSYYQAGLESVLAAPEVSVRENALRDWFDQTDLITPSRTRGLVLMGEESTGGLPNEAVEQLESAYLIRRTRRDTDSWFELAHDRLVEPILAANEAWRREHLKPVTVAAGLWSESDEDPRRLWSGRQLKQVERDARARPGEYTGLEERFVAASAAAVKRRRLSWFGAFLVGLALLAAVAYGVKKSVETAREAARADEMAYVSGIRLARRQLYVARQVEAADTVWRTPEGQRNWEWGLLLEQSHAWELQVADGDVFAAAWSPAVDRPLVAAASVAGTVTLWNPGTGAVLLELPACVLEAGSEGFFVDVRFSGDGRHIVTLCAGGVPRVWDTETGARLAPGWASQDPGSIDLRGFEGGRVLTLSDGKAEIWQWDAGEGERPLALAAKGVGAAALCRGGEWVVTGSKEGRIELWEAATGAPLAAQAGHQGAVGALACSPDGGRLISGGAEDKTAQTWSLTDRGALRLDPQQDLLRGKRLKHVGFAADGRLVVTVYEKKVMVWSAAGPEGGSWEETADLEGYKASRATFSPDGHRVLAEGPKSAVLWDWRSGTTREFKGPQDDEVQAAFSPDGVRVLTRFPGEPVVRVWDVDESRRRARWELDEDVITAEPTAAGVRVVTEDGRVLERADGAEDRATELPGLDDWISVAALSADGRRVVAASEQSALVWTAAPAESGGWEEPIRLPVGKVGCAAFSPDGARLAIASDDAKTVTIWDAATGSELVTTGGNDDRVLHVAFDPQGRRIVAASADGTARIWDAATGKSLAILEEGHEGRVRFADFSPDGRSVVTAGEDWTARVWSAESGEERAVLVGHEGRVVWADFSPDGTRILTASEEDGSARIWDLEGTELASVDGFRDLTSARFVAEPRPRLLAVWGGRRVDLVPVFPFRPEQLPGDPAATWKQRFGDFESLIRARSEIPR